MGISLPFNDKNSIFLIMNDFVIDDLSVAYVSRRHKEETVALSNISFRIKEGSFNVVLGPSGAGKTTLLKAIAGLLPYNGKIAFGNIDMSKRDPLMYPISYVSQEYILYPHMSVFDNIAFPLKAVSYSKNEIISSVKEVTDFLDLTYLWGRKPKELSGGQCQKVALARAMVKHPMIALFDEPLSNIDQEARYAEREWIKKGLKEWRATTFYVTHSLEETFYLADNIIILEDGKLLGYGSKEELQKSDNPKIREKLYANPYCQ